MEIVEIQDIPEIPKAIIDAHNSNTLLIFIGAGVSRLAGCDGWDDLSRTLIRSLSECKKPDGTKIVNFEETQILENLKDNRQKISICYELFRECEKLDSFYETLQKSFKPKKDKKIYDELAKFNAIFFTTNADELFDTYFLQSKIFSDFDDYNLKLGTTSPSNKLFHLHGCINNRSTLVFTLSEYLKRYQNTAFTNIVREYFDKSTVLFLGYSLSELELLQYIIKNDNNPLPKYALNGYMKNETLLLKYDKTFFGTLGIKIIPFNKSMNGYLQLSEIISDWVSRIEISSLKFSNTFGLIDQLVE